MQACIKTSAPVKFILRSHHLSLVTQKQLFPLNVWQQEFSRRIGIFLLSFAFEQGNPRKQLGISPITSS